jgi:hypothetical protein
MKKTLAERLFQRTEMWLSNAKASFFTKGILEAFDVINEILGMAVHSLHVAFSAWRRFYEPVSAEIFG